MEISSYMQNMAFSVFKRVQILYYIMQLKYFKLKIFIKVL